MKVLLTGITGFLGKILLDELYKNNIQVIRLGRDLNFSQQSDYIYVDNHISTQNFKLDAYHIDTVIHCAARVHVMNDKDSNPLDAFRAVNTNGTLNLAQQAANAGVKRFIFISSIKVNGESTVLGFPFKPDDSFIPVDPYGLSKYEAEIGLRKISEKTGMEVVIIRPPLVYGPGVKANFASMMKWVNRGLPLPFGGINANKRSLVSVDNLIDLIITCIEHPNAANQTFLVSDDEDVSTSQLLINMATALAVPNRLLPFPSSLFILAAKLICKPTVSQRLCGSLQVDISKTKKMLNWCPPYSTVECMRKTADAFINNNK